MLLKIKGMLIKLMLLGNVFFNSNNIDSNNGITLAVYQ